MFRLFLRRKKLIAAMSGALLMGTTYQAASCTVNVDEGLLQQLVDSIDSLNIHVNAHGDRHDGRGGGRHGDWDDDSDD